MADMMEAQQARKEVRRAGKGLQARLDKERKPGSWGVLGSMQDGDIMALATFVMMQASKSAQEDLKAIMAGVKAVNAAKARQRELLGINSKQRADADMLDGDSFVIAIASLQVDAMLAETQDDLDSMGALGEMQQLRLQMVMDRRAKMMSALCNIMKKIADTQDNIVSNLK